MKFFDRYWQTLANIFLLMHLTNIIQPKHFQILLRLGFFCLSLQFLLIFCFNFDRNIGVLFVTRLFGVRHILYLSLPVRVLLRASVSGVELLPWCRKARCNYQDVATWMIGYIVDAIGISITNMSFAILGCCSRYRPCSKKSTWTKADEGDAMLRFIGAIRFFITRAEPSGFY